jgi:DNA processing protein
MPEEKAFLHALGGIRPLLSVIRLRELVQAAGSCAAAWESSASLLQTLGWSDEQRQSFFSHRKTWNIDQAYARLRASDIEILSQSDARFPALLTHIYDPPLALYVRGELRAEEITVAVVGSRKATPYGKTATNMLVRPLASRGVTIVSGLAYGIDAEAHRATLGVRGRTIVVLGSGCDEASLYPRAHRELAREIVSSSGAVISEYPPGTTPQGYFFPQRNRIIAGCSAAVVVVEADEGSGALITARAALNENREVFAVPGPITSTASRGTNALLREGAAPARHAEDVLEELERSRLLPEPRTAAPDAPDLPKGDAGAVLTFVSGPPQSIDEIVEGSKLRPNVVASLLTLLELDGRVRDVGGKKYVRVS